MYKHLKFNYIFFAVMVYITWIIVFSFYNYQTSKIRLLSELDKRLELSVRNYVNIIPDDLHNKNMSKGDLTRKENYHLVLVSNEYAKINEVEYLYSIIKKDNKLYFTMGNATEEDMVEERINEVNGGGYYFVPYEAEPHFYKSFDVNEPIFQDTHDKWGDFRTVLIQHQSKDGTKFVIGADIKTSYIDDLLWGKLIQTFIISILFIFFAIPLILAFNVASRRLTKKLKLRIQERTAEIEKQAAELVLANKEKVKQAAESKNKRDMQSIMDNSPTVIYVKDIKGRFTFINNKFVELFHLKNEDIIGKTLHQVFPQDIAEEMEMNDKDVLMSEMPLESEEIVHHDDGVHIYHSIKFPLYDGAGNIYATCGMSSDITERKNTEKQLNDLAYYDNLTGLPNRRLFNDRLQQAINEAHRSEKLVAVLFLDLDHFKKINDSMGHQAGDILLKEAAQRFAGCIRVSDTLARLGGDEFTLVLSSLHHANDAIAVAENILQCFCKPIHVKSVELFISVSIGISLYPLDDSNADDMLRNADTAMYHAKDNGRNNFQFYSSEMTEKVARRLKLERELRDALLQNEFVLFYQPKIDTENNTIVGMEALIRWQHPQRGLVAPDDFISTAEETGLIIPIGKWVLEEACKQTQLLNASGIDPIHVSVNLSARQLEDPELPQIIVKILKDTKLNPSLLDLEITESMLMSDISKVIQTLKELSALGIIISLDDFGTGHSSLAYIKQFPISTLKIDRSFIRDTPENKDDVSITIAIINMADALGLKVVAEGVETKEQLDFLKQYKCDLIQGYYFSKPITLNELVKLFQVKLSKNKMVEINPTG